MSDTPQLLALMQKTREMKAYDCVKEFESLARKLEKENIAFKKEIKSVLDALNTAANEGGFDGYDEDTPLLVNLKSHWDRLYMTYDKELQRLKRVNADLFAWKEGKKGIEEYYSMVSQRDAARAENAALRVDKERLDFLGQTKCAYYYEGPRCWRINDDKNTDGDTLRAAIDAARKKNQP